MNELQIFENEDFGKIRMVMVNDEPYFVGKDVAEVLGYSNARDALAKRVDTEDKGGSKLRHPWRNTRNDRHQRKWSLLSYSLKQIINSEEI